MSVLAEDGSISNPFQQFISVSRYSKWLDSQYRRETWTETVSRYVEFMRKHLSSKYGYNPNDPVFDEVKQAILNLDVMPSMRALMTAGPALERSNIAGYNCAFVAIDHPRAFDEALYISMNGTGVGFSVERRHVEKLPTIPEIEDIDDVIQVQDSKEGWAVAFKSLLTYLWKGAAPKWDLSLIRPAGSKLKVFGGRASGPGPLEELFRFTVSVFKGAEGRKLSSLEAHDIMCKIGDCVVSGGVRRSALISLSDLDDFQMAKAKSGNWWENNGHRALANNSAVYTKKPTVTQFLREWRNLIESQSGERGIFNLDGIQKRPSSLGRDVSKIQGTNPCGEILLRSKQFCNLTEVVIKEDDTQESLAEKVRIATILGTWQSTLTHFPHIRKDWQKNCEEERLLGVSLTGIYGNTLTNDPDDPELPDRLTFLREVAHVTNDAEAWKLGINRSVAITTVKPSGTVSQLTGVSSGIHPWFSKYYVRTVRGNNTDPLTQMMKDAGFPHEPDVMKPDTTTVFSFPMKAPEGAVTRDDIDALDHLELWGIYRQSWTDHNPSVTINVREEEWLEVGAWVYRNWDKVGGISFLPYSDHVYQQAPYQAISRAEYEDLVARMPQKVRWTDLAIYEMTDSTTGSQSFACASDGSGCDVVDIGSV